MFSYGGLRRFTYVVSQDGASVSVEGLNDDELREKAHRIARKSLDTGKGAVTIERNGRLIATLTHKDRVGD